MNEYNIDPKRVKYTDMFNVVLSVLGVLFFAAYGWSDAAQQIPIAQFFINLAVSFLTVSMIYWLARVLLFGKPAATVDTFYGGTNQIYAMAQNHLSKLLRKREQVTVRIYAPVGLWYPSDAKDGWLEQVKNAANARRIYLKAVFGLPSKCQQDLSKPEESPARQRLDRLMNTHSADIRYIPPPLAEDHCVMPSAPGIGFIVFNDEMAFLGLAPHESEATAGSGSSLRDPTQGNPSGKGSILSTAKCKCSQS